MSKLDDMLAKLVNLNDVEYRVTRSEVESELRLWRRAPEKRRLLEGLNPRNLYSRVAPEAERDIVSSHRRLVYAVYAVEPGLGRLLVRRAGHRYAQHVLGDIDDVEEARFVLARRGFGILDFRGCRHGVCTFRVYECMTCSGVSAEGETLCEWEAGVIEYLASKLLGRSVVARETKCWSLGYTFCEFRVLPRG